MGARGPAAKPPELKLLEGNRGHRPLNLDQLFRPEVGVPDAPKWLLPEARKAWRRLSAELTHYNLLSKVDRDAFAMLCQTIGRMEQVERALLARQAALMADGKDPTDSYFDVTPNGLRIQSALYQVLNKEQAKLHRMLESFGLRPDARAKVTTAIRAQLQLFEVPKSETGKAPAGDPMGFADFE
jgi:P27 family predicted phage terminase small subunit